MSVVWYECAHPKVNRRELPAASSTADGVMSAADKAKLDSLIPPASALLVSPSSVEQSVSSSGVITVDPSQALTWTVVATNDIEQIHFLAGATGDRLVVAFLQSPDPRKAWPVQIFGALSVNGRFTKTLTANALDVYAYAWIGGTWVETSRTLLVA